MLSVTLFGCLHKRYIMISDLMCVTWQFPVELLCTPPPPRCPHPTPPPHFYVHTHRLSGPGGGLCSAQHSPPLIMGYDRQAWPHIVQLLTLTSPATVWTDENGTLCSSKYQGYSIFRMLYQIAIFLARIVIEIRFGNFLFIIG